MPSPLLTTFIAALLCFLRAAAAATISDFDWATIEPSTFLAYASGYQDHKCAKLVLPLGWLDAVENNATVTVAIIARPATVAESDESFGGTIIVNPGGPGSSGIGLLLAAGELGWQFRPKYQFTGPWTTPEPTSKQVDDRPAAPLLFISSLYDPVTPLSGAIQAFKGHW